MNIVVLNGSPKGDTSVTIHSVLYLQKKFPEHEFNILNIAKRIKGIERRPATFDGIIAEIAAADAILWAFPVYVLMVPARLKQFVELVTMHGEEGAFGGKYTAAISTSVHFYDHIAHRYIRGICDDLNMKFVGSFSADMMDLINAEERERLKQFGEHFLSAVQNEHPTFARYRPLVAKNYTYQPGRGPRSIEPGDAKVLVVTDARSGDINLQRMVRRFCSSFAVDVEVVNLHELKILSSCIGCLLCGYENECVFSERDDFVSFYLDKVLASNVLVFAGTMTDRYLSVMWKTYFDRSFFMGHIPALKDKQLGLIISGPLRGNENLREFFEGYAGWQHANLFGFVTEESGESETVDMQLQELARRGVEFAKNEYIQPSTFLGVGAHKVFRDEVWGRLRTVFQADHRAYKELGWYDFPMWDVPTHLMAGMGSLGMSIPRVREQIQQTLKHGVSFRHRKIVEKT